MAEETTFRQLLSRCFSSCFTSSVNAFNITNEHLVRARMLGDVGAVCDGLRACERGIGSVRGRLLAAGRVSTRCRRLERIVRTSGDKQSHETECGCGCSLVWMLGDASSLPGGDKVLCASVCTCGPRIPAQEQGGWAPKLHLMDFLSVSSVGLLEKVEVYFIDF